MLCFKGIVFLFLNWCIITRFNHRLLIIIISPGAVGGKCCGVAMMPIMVVPGRLTEAQAVSCRVPVLIANSGLG